MVKLLSQHHASRNWQKQNSYAKFLNFKWTKTIVTTCFEAKLAPSSARAEFITNLTSRQTQKNCTNETMRLLWWFNSIWKRIPLDEPFGETDCWGFEYNYDLLTLWLIVEWLDRYVAGDSLTQTLYALSKQR